MLSDREQLVLEWIEAHLYETDPELVRMFRQGPPRAGTPHGAPRVMIVFGLVTVAFGAVVAVVPLALSGMVLTFVGLWAASWEYQGLRLA